MLTIVKAQAKQRTTGVRWTLAEYQVIRKLAREYKVSLSECVRALTLEGLKVAKKNTK